MIPASELEVDEEGMNCGEGSFGEVRMGMLNAGPVVRKCKLVHRVARNCSLNSNKVVSKLGAYYTYAEDVAYICVYVLVCIRV